MIANDNTPKAVVFAADACVTTPQPRGTDDYASAKRSCGSLSGVKSDCKNGAVRWNRTSETRFPLAELRKALASLEFAKLIFEDLVLHDFEFRQLITDLLVEWETEDLDIRDFIDELSVAFILRLVADRVEYRSLPLRWHHQDVIDSGCVTLDDLTR